MLCVSIVVQRLVCGHGIKGGIKRKERKEMGDEVYYHSKSKGEEIPVSEMSDLYVRRAFKKMILKEKKRFDEKEKLKVYIRNAVSNLEKALDE